MKGIAVRRFTSTALQDAFKSTMARVSSQAMILTAGQFAPPSPASTSSLPISSLHGMTLSSTCSLSVFPTPLLQFNLHLPSYTSQTLHESSHLALHVLPPTPASVSLGRLFANGIKRPVASTSSTKPRLFDSGSGSSAAANPQGSSESPSESSGAPEEDDGEIFHEKTTPFDTLEEGKDWHFHSINGLQIPILNEAERAFICKKRSVFEIDSHEIWVVEVLQIISPNQKEIKPTGGLLYYNRNFHRIGDVLA